MANERAKRVYVASSWRNAFQLKVVNCLRSAGYDVYDFKDVEGFHWSEVDPLWKEWTPQAYILGLSHGCANRGFERDMKALRECDLCVYVMPCGPSASMEMGFAIGSGKPTAVFIPALREPDLMVKMADFITDDLQMIVSWADRRSAEIGRG